MIILPKFPVEGGCACGQVRYRLTEAPPFTYACHCTDCQTLTTASYSLNMPVRAETLEIASGALKTWIRVPPSGNRIPQHVCSHCGVRIFTTAPARPGIRTLRCGSLDDTSWTEPVAAIWMKSAQPWVRMPEGCLLFEESAADFPALAAARFKQLTGGS